MVWCRNKLWIATWEILLSNTKGLCNKVINFFLPFKPLVCSFDLLPWDIFLSFPAPNVSRSVNCSGISRFLSFFFFGALTMLSTRYLCINSRHLPDINECTLWIFWGLFKFLCFSPSRTIFIDIINIIWNFDNIFFCSRALLLTRFETSA